MAMAINFRIAPPTPKKLHHKDSYHSKTNMSIGAKMRPTSPNLMEDVELGSSSSINKSGTARTRPIKAKDSNIELQPLVEPSSDNRRASDGESSSLAKSIVATTMYSGCSIGMVLVNKSLASR